MTVSEKLKQEIDCMQDRKPIGAYWRFLGYRAHYDEPFVLAKAWGIKSIFENYEKHIYQNDLIAGSQKGLFLDAFDDAELGKALEICSCFEFGNFSNNFDHFAPEYERFLSEGIPGVLRRIEESAERHGKDPEKLCFLNAAKLVMEGFANLCRSYAEAADRAEKPEIAGACRRIAEAPPQSFREALQLVWLTYQAFLCEDRYAMAFGRMDQYLAPFYRRDLENGTLCYDDAVTLLESVFIKLYEFRRFRGGDEVANICIGGITKEGTDAVNALSYAILEAVERVRIPGPNLSARIHRKTADPFVIACLNVIGTGIGYPALMNDEVNIPALIAAGHTPEDAANYCMVGCIENFIPGKEPPWSDGRYNAPLALEAVFNNGRSILSGRPAGLPCELDKISSMDAFLTELKKQMEFLAAEYMVWFRSSNMKISVKMRAQPFLSCFCDDCIDRGRDVLDGGSRYPSVHGAVCMGIGTMADSLAAVESVVFLQKKYTLREIALALKADFAGYEELRRDLLAAPKYGNNDTLADQYAVWYLDTCHEIFDRYRTADGGRIYIAMGSNISNIAVGTATAATPDGRRAGRPISDAASPTYRQDRNGITAALLSCAKPDYKKAACGTVLNRKFTSGFFKNKTNVEKLCSLIRTYFELGGQEIQINAVSREILQDAVRHPEEYRDLMVRVSGFSAFFVQLDPAIQNDILSRTEYDA